MNSERATRIWTDVAMRARRDASPMSPGHACLACVDAVGASGAGLALTTDTKSLEPVFVTDNRFGEVEELQATVGQGPGLDAMASGQPVLVSDLAAASHMWPLFVQEAYRLGVRTMCSLPLALGAIRVGVLDLYSDTSSEFDRDQLLDALMYADTALLLVLDARSGITTSSNGDSPGARAPMLRHAEVHQAAGMISVQQGISVLDALVLLRSHAYGHDIRLTDVARAVVERRLRFDSERADPGEDNDLEGRR